MNPTRPTDGASWMRHAESELLELASERERTAWVHATHINPDTQAISARAEARKIEGVTRLAAEARQLAPALSGGDLARKSILLRLTLSTPGPSEPAAGRELTAILREMEEIYSTGRYRPAGAPAPLDQQELSHRMESSRVPEELADLWSGWHAIARPIRPKFTRYVELANRGARELGFADTGALWRSKYDMPPEEFAADVERVWQQVRPLYEALHAYVRRKLREHYGPAVVPVDGPIPAHLLGNLWAQSWEALLPLVAPSGMEPGFDLTEILRRRGTTPTEMVRYAERFFTSLDFDPLPATFWERSMLVRPRDREVVCHASAWDLDYDADLRIKMCIDITAEDFSVIHHELGHNFYQRAYRAQPFLFRESANDGFHEAIGDTVALSVTPEYLVRIGLLDRAPGPSRDLGLLLRMALEKVAFLPFGYLIDRWRWDVFSGAIPPTEYNASWWELRRRYQGIAPPVARSESEFDPGAKYHVPSSVPYMRYFLAHILEFQFHRALARIAGDAGPLHRASI